MSRYGPPRLATSELSEIGAVAFTVVGVGVAAGLLVAILVVVRGSSDDDTTDLDRATIRRYLAQHPVVLRVARLAPRDSAPAVVEALAIAFVIVVFVGTLVGIFLVMVRNEIGLVRADTPIAEWAATNATDSGTTLMRELSKFGGTEYILIGAVAVTAIAVSRDRRWAVPLYVVATMIGQFLVSNSIKWIVERARPDLANLTGFSGTSFPSGHAVAGAAAWACVAFLVGRRRSMFARAALYGLAAAIGAIVAGTRVALGVHWTTDVIIGAIIGWAWFAICTLVFGAAGIRTGASIKIAAEVDRPHSSRRDP